jgi:integrase
MRHTFASICYYNDVPVKKISELMGHANERVTLTVYVHLFNPDVAETDDLDDIWGSGKGTKAA